ncbi:MAG: hypothetical protein PG981_001129 [Wolbachia endosymbiont of Ctenocephalides orientis wCori]|nr:MAG: hypothetical protein PG981_001129 [Wolbachia endosymbiont of Ctenocephalides orientis wCori]
MLIVSSQSFLLSSQCVIHSCTNSVFVSHCGVIPVLRHWDPAFLVFLLVYAFIENVKIICRQSLLDPSVTHWDDTIFGQFALKMQCSYSCVSEHWDDIILGVTGFKNECLCSCASRVGYCNDKMNNSK